jgi:hypothetical protein
VLETRKSGLAGKLNAIRNQAIAEERLKPKVGNGA